MADMTTDIKIGLEELDIFEDAVWKKIKEVANGGFRSVEKLKKLIETFEKITKAKSDIIPF